MTLKKVIIENVGPIKNIEIVFPKSNQKPKPLLIVGENGTGKSILLSHLVNSLVVGKQEIFDDVEVEKGKAYKYRSPDYVNSGEYYSFSSVEFDSGQKVQEWQLLLPKDKFEEKLKYVPMRSEWNQIPNKESSYFNSTFRNSIESTKDIFEKQCNLYFPVNRFEEPAWLNLTNLTAKASYTDLKKISGHSNRDLICTSPLKKNINWLLDIIFDRQAFDLKTQNIQVTSTPGQPPTILKHFTGFEGQSSKIYAAILEVIKVILRESGNIRLGAGTRQNRQISVMKNEKVWVPNLFQLSTGEVQLLNLFFSIVRDYDLSYGEFNDLSDIKGTVIIDEIDSHLHAVHQKDILPKLIQSFPGVQFIITTHAPLFLLGMERTFGEDGFDIINMPDGQKMTASDFSEFNTAYDTFKNTTKHREEIKRELDINSKPIVFVEGDYDIRYLNKAATLLNKEELLSKIQLKNAVGFGNLDKVWKSFNNVVSEAISSKIILLYDCDTNKQNSNKNLLFKRVIPPILENPISIGIENLFSVNTIEKIEGTNPQFIDIHEQTSKRIRGQMVATPTIKSVNKDEKGNMCNWLCENGDLEDFSGFSSAFQIIEDVING
ncbi:AAA family ATPase [Microbulbifer sp. TRSA005]|uniref:AAA family ATPase n=1 Tax=Microbulbifer sp. TRSA005 TaxID=3243383 RepID=UPI00403A3833